MIIGLSNFKAIQSSAETDVEEVKQDLADLKSFTEESLNKKADLVNGKIPVDQIPDEFNDTLVFEGVDAFPRPGEEGILYVDGNTGKPYIWDKELGDYKTADAEDPDTIPEEDIINIFK